DLDATPAVERVECHPGAGYVPAVPVLPELESSADTAAEDLALDLPTRSAAAVHAEAAKKTFFVYLAADQPVVRPGGPEPEEGAETDFPLRISWFDHSTGTVARPCIPPVQLDAGDITGLSLTLDEAGHVWLAVSMSRERETILLKSAKPY